MLSRETEVYREDSKKLREAVMAGDQYLLAVDVGTQSVRAIVFDREGGRVASRVLKHC